MQVIANEQLSFSSKSSKYIDIDMQISVLCPIIKIMRSKNI